MAYNREWDKGKEAWQDQNWNDHNARGNVRGRDEDYYGEGKRRKHNDGVRSLHFVFPGSVNESRATGPPPRDTTIADMRCILRGGTTRISGPTMERNDMGPVNPART